MATKFSKRTLKGVKPYRVDEGILTSSQRTPMISRDMNAIISTANKRIKRIRQSGLTSTALEMLDKESGKGNFKFSLRGKSFDTQKATYARAIQFLQNPTSQVSGAREFAQQIYKENESKILDILESKTGIPAKFMGIKDENILSIVNDIIKKSTDMLVNGNDFSYKSPIIRELVESNLDTELENLSVDVVSQYDEDKDFFDFMDSQIQ